MRLCRDENSSIVGPSLVSQNFPPRSSVETFGRYRRDFIGQSRAAMQEKI